MRPIGFEKRFELLLIETPRRRASLACIVCLRERASRLESRTEFSTLVTIPICPRGERGQRESQHFSDAAHAVHIGRIEEIDTRFQRRRPDKKGGPLPRLAPNRAVSRSHRSLPRPMRVLLRPVAPGFTVSIVTSCNPPRCFYGPALHLRMHTLIVNERYHIICNSALTTQLMLLAEFDNLGNLPMCPS